MKTINQDSFVLMTIAMLIFAGLTVILSCKLIQARRPSYMAQMSDYYQDQEAKGWPESEAIEKSDTDLGGSVSI